MLSNIARKLLKLLDDEITRTTRKSQLAQIICCAAYFILMYGNTFHNRFRKSDAINLNDNMICWPRINRTYLL